MSNAQQKAAEMFDKTRTSRSINMAKKTSIVLLIIAISSGVSWIVGNMESSSTAYRLVNVWVEDEDYRDLVPMIRSALDDGVLRQTEWWKISSRQEEIEQTRQREALLTTVITGLP